MTLHEGRLVSGSGETDLKIWSGYKRHIVDGILTGIHEPSESHFRLLEAVVDPKLLRRTHAAAEENGYRSHEFGDSCLILSDTNVAIPLAKVAYPIVLAKAACETRAMLNQAAAIRMTGLLSRHNRSAILGAYG